MYNLGILVDSLSYIEQNICKPLKTEEICLACGCSKSALEKIFRNINGISVHDYVTRRKMMYAALDISRQTQRNLLDVALDYGYQSNESFMRAFRRVWNCKPSEFKGKKFYELYPKLRSPIMEKGELIMNRKNVDISELYDLFVERRHCYFICCDIKSMIPINEISRKAGDLAIIEAMNRMSREAGEQDCVFRIGGDEFCIVTASQSEEYAKELSERIKRYNGKPFSYGEQAIPLTLHVTYMNMEYSEDRVQYDVLFSDLHRAIRKAKNTLIPC